MLNNNARRDLFIWSELNVSLTVRERFRITTSKDAHSGGAEDGLGGTTMMRVTSLADGRVPVDVMLRSK